MFTGIIQAVGKVQSCSAKGGDVRLCIQSRNLDFSQVVLGDSIASNGVCLTAIELGSDYFCADVSRESLAHSTIGSWQSGTLVNLELAMTPTSFFGGHIVSGHVDTVAKIVARHRDARSIRFELELPAAYSKYIAAKGSVCIDGVSLTVNSQSGNRFSINIVPHTLDKTSMQNYVIGSLVNLEVDVLARYIERLLQAGDKGDIELADLANAGFI